MAGAGSSRAYVEKRLTQGQTQECAHSHHQRCAGPPCPCRCHSEPGWAEKMADNARRARAARGGHRQEDAPARVAAAETAPKRPDLKQGVKAALPTAAARQVKSEFALVLWAADQGAAKLAPTYWQTPEDRLTDDERTTLVNAVYNELEVRAPRLLKLLARAGESATEAALLYAIAVVAAPRLARHGVISPELASAITFAPILIAYQQQQAAAAVDASERPTANVGTEPTPEFDWSDRDGQIDARSVPAAPAPIQAGASVEAGLGDLRHGSGDPNSGRNGQHPL